MGLFKGIICHTCEEIIEYGKDDWSCTYRIEKEELHKHKGHKIERWICCDVCADLEEMFPDYVIRELWRKKLNPGQEKQYIHVEGSVTEIPKNILKGGMD